ncbi:HAD-IC family P-type ATPase [Aquincola sp. MAHUQ-54]|uniref:HAD-IC family P-type ATPase n=1 Tax=Aquincola agrisoli TaxID=3119538 RepID=A0AAW9Q8U7_9BURK
MITPDLPQAPPEPAQGLSSDEARRRLARDGPNRLPPPDHKTLRSTIAATALQPMVLLLLAATTVYTLLGEALDGVVLACSIVAVVAISVYQEMRTQRVLEALRDLSSPRSTVVRDGAPVRIASQELVEGDRLVVQEGDRLACDARLLEAHAMQVDESLLTGESAPVAKAAADGDDALRAGTLVVQGDGVACVTATGVRTALGRIGGSIAGLRPPASRLQSELRHLVRIVALLAMLTCLLAAVFFAARSGSWTAGLLVGLTLAMAVVPEEFAVVWTVMLALGAWRLARLNVLTRQPQAIEALGTTTVLCVDKTGTLTCNRMEVVALHDGAAEWARAGGSPPGPAFDALLRAAARASVDGGIEPMDSAIARLAPARGGGAALRFREGTRPGRPYVVHGWADDGGIGTVAVKGAPEAVLALCADAGDGRIEGLRQAARVWARRGLRVIAVAQAPWREGEAVPVHGHAAVGLIGFLDPLRTDVPAALAECRAAGVRVVMITGDAPETALAIAGGAGLVDARADDGAVLTGAALDTLGDAAFARRLPEVAVFARVTPAQKLRIVQALQQRGEVVAMTGDGVNDGPALRAADIGVAMGQRGTDVAREAAGLVLLDDRFGSLVDAVRAGRRIFVNLQKALGYLFAVHVPIVGLSLLPLFGGPVLLLPLHVVLLELIIDPACSLVFEAEPLPPDGMRRPPRPASAPLFGPAAVAQALGVGGVAFAAVAAGQWLGHRAGLGDDALRLAGLATVVAGNLAMLQWFRAGAAGAAAGNRLFDGLVLAVCGVAAASLLMPPVSAALRLPADLDWRLVVLCLAPPAALAGRRLLRARRQTHPA